MHTIPEIPEGAMDLPVWVGMVDPDFDEGFDSIDLKGGSIAVDLSCFDDGDGREIDMRHSWRNWVKQRDLMRRREARARDDKKRRAAEDARQNQFLRERDDRIAKDLAKARAAALQRQEESKVRAEKARQRREADIKGRAAELARANEQYMGRWFEAIGPQSIKGFQFTPTRVMHPLLDRELRHMTRPRWFLELNAPGLGLVAIPADNAREITKDQ